MALARSATLVGRVARATAVGAAAGATFAALVAGILLDRLILAQEDRRLTDAAGLLAAELEAHGRNAGEARATADEELRELAHTGMRIALFEGGARLGGDAGVALPEQAGCGGNAVRICALAAGARTIVVSASLERLAGQRRLFALASAIAVLLAAIVGVAASRAAAAWTARPLTRLRDAVRAFSIDAPRWSALTETYGCEEIDAVRVAFHDLIGRLETALAQSQRFAADAAHELRTPLTTLRAEVDLLLESHDPVADRAALDRLRCTLVGLQRLTDRLLILATPSETAVAREAVAMVDVVSEVVAALPAVERARIEIHEQDEGTVRGDPALLTAMVANAVDNSLKFSRAAVTITVAAEAGRVSVVVEDRGPGVPEDERELVFQPFYRSPAARASVAGHGVGLALIAHVARAHGGQARFEPAPHGARLRLSLPTWSGS